jgi:hypothetical protein
MAAGLLMLVVCASAFSAGVDPGEVGVIYNCAFPIKDITLDGKLDEPFWKLAPWHKVSHDMGWNNPKDDQDGSLEFACVADEEYLYVAIKVWDDKKVVDEDVGCNVWKDDSVEIYIDGGNEKAPAYDGNDSQITIGRDNVGGDPDKPKLGGCVGQLQGPNTGTKAGVVDTDYGWSVEAAVPLDSFGIKLADGTVIGFNVQLNDDDDKGARDHKLAWSKKERQVGERSWQDPSVFGELKFVKANLAVSPQGKLATTWASIRD